MQRLLLSSRSSTRMLISGLLSVPKVPSLQYASDSASEDSSIKTGVIEESSKVGVVSETPSGWAPPNEALSRDLPFVVRRSRMDNFSVYLRHKSGKNRTLTYIKKIDGDVQEFERRLRIHLNNKKLLSRVDEMAGTVILDGKYAEEVKIWLLSLGF